MKKFPSITFLQWRVLILLSRPMIGAQIHREMERRYEMNQSAPAFYQMLDRLKNAGLISSRGVRVPVQSKHAEPGAKSVRANEFRVTKKGKKERQINRRFYREAIRESRKRERVDVQYADLE